MTTPAPSAPASAPAAVASVEDEITSFSPGSGRRVAPRAHLRSSAPAIDLSGQWAFCFSPDAASAPGGAEAEDFDDSGWDRIPVPSHWVLEGDGEYGRPAYTNVQFPFPVDVPHVPDENPTGDYRVVFTLSERAEGERTILRLLGAESLAIVSVNGERAGVVRGSRLTQELDITALTREGENLLHVRVHQFSAHSYLEDQDQWWLPGIFREVEVLTRPGGGIDDVWLRADVDPATLQGTLLPEIRAEASAFPITVEIEELGLAHVFDSAADVGPIPVGEVEPWSADVPRLYAVQVRGAAETVDLRAGFRRVEIVGHEWRVNGRKLRLRGVNRHEFDPLHGRVFGREQAREGLLMMKRSNINAVRTAHYPPHPELLELTDEIGLWVIDECDLETHGFELGGWIDNPTDDPRWRDALLDRVERFFERDKNHPSVICWSLGNESHTGRNLAAMAAWLHHRDPERPVHYEGDYEGRYTDLVSRMYATVEEMREMAAGILQEQTNSPGRNAVLAQRPMMLCEYVHAMGNGPGGIEEYERVFEEEPQWHGGFVWEWRDHGLLSRTADGTEFSAYGGDFGEPLHDGSFVCDGMVMSDGTPSPALAEYKAVVSPIALEIADAASRTEAAGGAAADAPAVLRVGNRRHAGDTSDLRFLVIDEADGREIARTVLEVPPVGPGESVEVELPQLPDAEQVPVGAELWRTVRAELAADAPWAQAGHEIVTAQQQLRPARGGLRLGAPSPSASRPAPVREGDVIRLGDAVFDARTGDLRSLGDLDLAGPVLTLWRAPIENDVWADSPSLIVADPTTTHGRGAPAPSTAQMWRDQGLDRMQRRVVEVREEGSALVVRHRCAPAASRSAVEVELRWTMEGDGLRLEASANPSNGWTGTWPRIGLRFTLPAAVGRAEWFGTGPQENYSDSRAAARVGRFQAELEELTVPYAVPQESGHRADLRELLLPEISLAVRTAVVGGKRPGFSLRAHDEHEVTAAAHPHELGEPRAAHLYLDAGQHGLGTRSCGPDVRPEHQLRPCAAQWSVRLSRQ